MSPRRVSGRADRRGEDAVRVVGPGDRVEAPAWVPNTASRSASSSRPAKLTYTPPVAKGLSAVPAPPGPADRRRVVAGSVQPASMLTLNRAPRWAKALSSSPTRRPRRRACGRRRCDDGVGRSSPHASRAAGRVVVDVIEELRLEEVAAPGREERVEARSGASRSGHRGRVHQRRAQPGQRGQTEALGRRAPGVHPGDEDCGRAVELGGDRRVGGDSPQHDSGATVSASAGRDPGMRAAPVRLVVRVEDGPRQPGGQAGAARTRTRSPRPARARRREEPRRGRDTGRGWRCGPHRPR